jgi:type 2 lantibiotic biosynthesis protein LanM
MSAVTPAFLRELAAKASTIDERLAGEYIARRTQAGQTKAEDRMRAWLSSAADGDLTSFQSRLAHLRVPYDEILSLLGDVELIEKAALPSWVGTFTFLLEAIQLADVSRGSRSDEHDEQGDAVPFAELFVPAIIITEERRDRSLTCRHASLFAATALSQMRYRLLKSVCDLCAPTLYDRFLIFQSMRTPLPSKTRQQAGFRHEYDSFIAEMRSDAIVAYFEHRPVLARLLATITDQWINTTKEIIERFAADAPAIREEFHLEGDLTTVIDLEFNISDPHNSGRGVSILELNNGSRIVYKPKDLSVDIAWSALLEWLKARGAPATATAPKVLSRNGYGWVEWISPKPCTKDSEVDDFFYRAGSMLCLAHFLHSTDMHEENVIAHGNQPVMFDLETLLQPICEETTAGESGSAMVKAHEYLTDSVLFSGYLPTWTVLPGLRVVRRGGLNTPDCDQVFELRFVDNNTDAMRIERRLILLAQTYNLPVIAGKQFPSWSYADKVVTGFIDMYRFFVDHSTEIVSIDGPIVLFKAKTIRVVLRPTQFYALLLKRSLEKNNLNDGADWSIVFEFLSRFSLPQPVQKEERRALVRLDIPFFRTQTDSTLLQISESEDGGATIPLRRSGFENAMLRLSRLSLADLETQAAIIRHVLRGSANEHQITSQQTAIAFQADGPALSSCEAIDQTLAIAALLERQAFQAGDGLAWVGVLPLSAERYPVVEVLGYDLYSGMAGISLFFAALAHLTGEDSFRELALKSLARIRGELCDSGRSGRLARKLGIGAAVGIGGLIYALTRVGTLLEITDLVKDAYVASKLITKERILGDRLLDVMSGAAGAILVLLTLHQEMGDELSLDLAMTCGRHLLDRQEACQGGGKSWRTAANRFLTGFSHGAAGIALSLSRLFEATGHRPFLDAALAPVEFEESAFSGAAGNWPDLRADVVPNGNQAFACRWCNGASGIGLARLGSLPMMDERVIQNDIWAALHTTIDYPKESLDNLCCGNFGRIETIFSAGQMLNRPELISLSRQRARELICDAADRKSFQWRMGDDAYNPSFFTGLAGAGYEILRITHPHALKSVLLWQ